MLFTIILLSVRTSDRGWQTFRKTGFLFDSQYIFSGIDWRIPKPGLESSLSVLSFAPGSIRSSVKTMSFGDQPDLLDCIYIVFGENHVNIDCCCGFCKRCLKCTRLLIYFLLWPSEGEQNIITELALQQKG